MLDMAQLVALKARFPLSQWHWHRSSLCCTSAADALDLYPACIPSTVASMPWSTSWASRGSGILSKTSVFCAHKKALAIWEEILTSLSRFRSFFLCVIRRFGSLDSCWTREAEFVRVLRC
jgi:hypothetical protein